MAHLSNYIKCLVSSFYILTDSVSIIPLSIVGNATQPVLTQNIGTNIGTVSSQSSSSAGIVSVSYKMPVSNVFANYYLKATETQSLLDLLNPEFFISLFSHLINVNPTIETIVNNNGNLVVQLLYVDKAGIEQKMIVPYNSELRNANRPQVFFELLAANYSTKFMEMITNIDIVLTMNRYMKEARVQTGVLLPNMFLDTYLEKQDYKPSYIEKGALVQALMNKVLNLPVENIAYDVDLFDKADQAKARDLYDQGVLGQLDSSVMAIIQFNAAEKSFAFDSLQMLEYLQALLNKSKVKQLIDDYQSFMVELKVNNVTNQTIIPHIFHNALGLMKILDSNFSSLQDVEQYLSSYCEFTPQITQSILLATDMETKAGLMLEGYNLPNVGALRTKLIRILLDNKSIGNTIPVSYVGALRNWSIDYDSKVFYVLPIDPEKEIDYTGFAAHVSLGKKISLLSLLGVFKTSDQALLNNILNVTNGDYTNAVNFSSQTYSELEGKTIQNFIEDLCLNAKEKRVAHKNNKTIWELWIDGITLNYYNLEDTWTGVDPVLNILFETELYNKIWKKNPVGTRPVLGLVGEIGNGKKIS